MIRKGMGDLVGDPWPAEFAGRGHHSRGAGVQHGGRRAAGPARPGAGDVSEPLLAVDDLRVLLGIVRTMNG